MEKDGKVQSSSVPRATSQPTKTAKVASNGHWA